jgi:hypothetical protein
MPLNCIIISSFKELALQNILCTDHEMVLVRNVMMRMRKIVTTHLEISCTLHSLATCYTKCLMFLVCVVVGGSLSLLLKGVYSPLHRTRGTCTLAVIISRFVVCGLTCLK